MWEVSPPSAECLMYTVTPTVTQCGRVTALEVRIGIGTYWCQRYCFAGSQIKYEYRYSV